MIRNLVVLNNTDVITPELLPPPLNNVGSNVIGAPKLTSSQVSRGPDLGPSIMPLWMAEKEIIEHAISECGGNIPKAAAMLEISPSTVYRKKQTWESMVNKLL